MSKFQEEVLGLKERAQVLADAVGLTNLKKELNEVQSAMQAPDFWSNAEGAQRTSRLAGELEKDIAQIEGIQKAIEELADVYEMAQAEADETMLGELEAQKEVIAKDLKSAELKAYLSGEYDKGGALVSIHAGAGGTDASDWAEMVARMLMRYAEKREWTVEVIEEARAEEAGIKRMTFAVRGRYAYGYLKQEAGVHRLVRISPFDAEGMRHTSFCLVEVIPELDAVSEQSIVIPAEDLRIDTFASSGAGGQSVNTTNSAVRITHIPTNTVVSVQNERSQQQNRETAMRTLKSRLLQMLIQEQKAELSELRGAHVKPEWGSQIRSYVQHPYKMVKDHRTGIETQDIDAVLGGDLDAFIEAALSA